MAAEYRRNYPSDFASVGPATKELDALIRSYPDEANLARLSRDFGAPHPILKQSYGSELLNLKPFPSFMGYPSRLLAETWDSDNLYWARLADERGYAPETLNNVVPLLTHRMVEKIFATDFEDWRAVLRALHRNGRGVSKGRDCIVTKAGYQPAAINIGRFSLQQRSLRSFGNSNLKSRQPMARHFTGVLVLFVLLTGSAAWIAAQDNKSDFHVVVDLVQLNVAVTDNKGNYITGLNRRTSSSRKTAYNRRSLHLAKGTSHPER